jgi:hypothetical protein
MLALLLAGPVTVSIAPADERTQVVTDAGDIVAVTDFKAGETEVGGMLVNRTDKKLTDVTLLVTDSFRWKNEFHPGDDDPGRAATIVIHGPIEPRGSVPFRVDRELPVRRDGWFETRVDLLQLTMFETSNTVASADGAGR